MTGRNVVSDELWVRPYTATAGRTRPTQELDVASMVRARDGVTLNSLAPEYVQTLNLCRTPTSVAEVAAGLRLPVTAAKVVLSDLIEAGAIVTQPLQPPATWVRTPEVLLRLRDGLAKLR
jgi:hypothetical protein